MTQENHDINQQLLDHLESGTWDPYHQQHTSASDKARLVFDIQQRVRRTNMQRLSSRPFRAMVWVLVLFMFAAAGWAFINQSESATVDNLVNPNLAENTYASELVGAEPVPTALKAIRFGEDLYLSDYEIRIVKLKDKFHFTFDLYWLFWKRPTDLSSNPSLFVHLMRQDGSLIAQYDRSLYDSDISLLISLREGIPDRQFFVFALEGEMITEKPFRVFFGLYDRTTGSRLPVSYLDQPQVDDQLLFAEINSDGEQELIITRDDNGTMVVTVDPSETTLTLWETQSLLLINEEGVAIVALQFSGWDENISYHWRHLSFSDGVVTSDEGIMEKSVGDELHLVAAKRELSISSDLSVKWSFAGNNHGWIYYDPNLIDVQVIDDDFDTFDLSTVMP